MEAQLYAGSYARSANLSMLAMSSCTRRAGVEGYGEIRDRGGIELSLLTPKNLSIGSRRASLVVNFKNSDRVGCCLCSGQDHDI